MQQPTQLYDNKCIVQFGVFSEEFVGEAEIVGGATTITDLEAVVG
jgi:hypothetical protein